MKRFALILALCGLLLSILGCKQAKEGPFTFTNKTQKKVYAIISQDKTIEKEFDAGESYTGEDYFAPKISFVKDFASEENKKITDNRFAASTTNGFDYTFNEVPNKQITICLDVPRDFLTKYPDYQNWYIKEVNGKLGTDSNTKVIFSDLMTTQDSSNASQSETPPGNSYQGTIYTDKPEFRIYRSQTVEGKTEEEDITNFFSVVLNESEILPEGTSTESTTEDTTDTISQTKPALQLTLEIIYPKIRQKTN